MCFCLQDYHQTQFHVKFLSLLHNNTHSLIHFFIYEYKDKDREFATQYFVQSQNECEEKIEEVKYVASSKGYITRMNENFAEILYFIHILLYECVCDKIFTFVPI